MQRSEVGALRKGTVVELEFGGTVTVETVAHDGLFITGTNYLGRMMRVRYDAIERVVS